MWVVVCLWALQLKTFITERRETLQYNVTKIRHRASRNIHEELLR